MKGCRSLSDEEVVEIIGVLKSKRDVMLFTMGIKSGLRISELLSLTIKDVMEHGKVGTKVTVKKCNTKGKQESKTLPLTESVRTAIQAYLDEIKVYDLNDPLFKGGNKKEGPYKAISRIQAHRILKDAFNKLKLTGNLATHSCRKTYAKNIHKALGNDLLKTQKAMCHKSLSSTVQYLDVSQEEVEDAILGLG